MSTDAESHDDVVGLFKRLGRRADTGQYHEFSPPAITASASAPPPLTPAVADSAPAAVASPAPAPAPLATATATTAPPPIATPAVGATPLAALFQRLAQVPLADPAQSPLAQLRRR